MKTGELAVVGTWRRDKATAKRVTVGLAPFGALSATTLRAVHRRLARYGEFLGVEVVPASPAAAGGRAR